MPPSRGDIVSGRACLTLDHGRITLISAEPLSLCLCCVRNYEAGRTPDSGQARRALTESMWGSRPASCHRRCQVITANKAPSRYLLALVRYHHKLSYILAWPDMVGLSRTIPRAPSALRSFAHCRCLCSVLLAWTNEGTQERPNTLTSRRRRNKDMVRFSYLSTQGCGANTAAVPLFQLPMASPLEASIALSPRSQRGVSD